MKGKYEYYLWNGTYPGYSVVDDLDISYSQIPVPYSDGVYVGVTGFNGEVNSTKSIDEDGILVLDENQESENALNTFVNNLEQDDNTALYAAMGESVDILNNASMPKLSNNNIFTFHFS